MISISEEECIPYAAQCPDDLLWDGAGKASEILGERRGKMKLEQLYDFYREGKVPKRLCWQLTREGLLPLLDVQRLLQKNPACEEVLIREDGIILQAKGIRLFFDMSQNVCRAEAILIGTESEEIALMTRFVPEGGTVFDIGANIGRVSLGLAKAHPDCTIYAFEPVEETFHGMERNLALNKEGERIKAYHMGFYSESGDLKFFVPSANEAASLRPITDVYYLKEGDRGQGELKDHLEEVFCPVDTLDHFVKEHQITRMDFLKCDTEGAEKMVFGGGVRVFRELRPVVYTEMLRKHAARFDYHPNEIIEMFREWGYSCHVAQDDRLVPFAEMDESTLETNFFFLHEEKHRELLAKYGG